MSILLGLGVGVDRGAGIVYVVQDTFTDVDTTTLPNHDPDIDLESGGWVLSRWGSPLTTVGNRADGGNWANHGGCVIDAGITDYILICTIRLKAGTYQGFILGGSGAGVGDFDGWCIIYQPASDRWWAMDSYPGGGGEGSMGIHNEALDETGATPYAMKFEKSGNDYTVYMDDAEIISWTNAKYNAATHVGFYGWLMDNGTFDDFCVYAP